VLQVCCGASNCLMDAEKIIADIEALEQLLILPDPRPLRSSDVAALNRQHDEKLARNPWFQLWSVYWK